MKAIFFTIIISVFPITFLQAQDGNKKLTECKSLTLKMFQGEKLQDQLTSCIVGLSVYGSDFTTAYTNWASQRANHSRESMQNELDQLENMRQQSKEIRQQSFSNMLNDVNVNLQNQIQQKSVRPSGGSVSKCPYNNDGDPTTVCTQR